MNLDIILALISAASAIIVAAIGKHAVTVNKKTEKLEKESVDVTLPGVNIENGAPSILESVIEEFEKVFMSLGYDVRYAAAEYCKGQRFDERA